MEVTVKNLDWMLSSEAQAAALPWVKILQPESPAEKKRNQATPYIAGTAIFRKDRMVGQVNDRTTRGVLWIRDEIKSAVASVSPPEANGFISMTLIQSETKLIPSINQGKWKMTIKAKTEDDVLQNGTKLNIMEPSITRMLETELRKQVESYMKVALRQVQINMKADVLGFARAFHRAYPKEWNENKQRWNEIFPQVEVEFEIEAHVRRTGEVGIPSGMPKDEVEKR
jgi:spore germination protein KC